VSLEGGRNLGDLLVALDAKGNTALALATLRQSAGVPPEMVTLLKGAEALPHNSDGSVITAEFAKLVPDYDEGKVYLSDMRKFFQWYNTLVRFGFFVDAPEAKEPKSPAKTAKKKAPAAPKAEDGE
jgi:hypothetical protein